ncbi:MAG TPA: DUF4258 domain-containing protein [Myxococcales bacterium]|jgi:hypothetical protein
MTPEELRALEDVRGYARAGRIALTDHASQRMRERRITWENLRLALASAGSCTEARGGAWSVRGVDRSGEDLSVIVSFEDAVVVVTVF